MGHLAEGSEFSDLIAYGELSEGFPVGDSLRGGLGDIGENQHGEEDAEDVKSYPAAVDWKMSDGRVEQCA